MATTICSKIKASMISYLHCWVTLKEEGKEWKAFANIILWKKEGLEKD